MSRAAARVEKLKEQVEAKRAKRVEQKIKKTAEETEGAKFRRWMAELKKAGWCSYDELVLACRWNVMYAEMSKLIDSLGIEKREYVRTGVNASFGSAYIMVPDWTKKATSLWYHNYKDTMDLKTFLEKTNATEIQHG